MKIFRLLAVLIAVSAISVSALGQASRYVAGTHYQELATPLRTADGEKIEVIELFCYGCPSCYAFEPLMANWESSQQSDIDHKRLPAVWDPITKIHAQAFYAAEALGSLDAVHNPFFDEYHQNRNRLHTEVVIQEFFKSCGISKEYFDSIFNSFSVRTRVNQAERKMREYGPAQTPSLYVNGKYVVTLGDGGFRQMLDVVDYLVSLERG